MGRSSWGCNNVLLQGNAQLRKIRICTWRCPRLCTPKRVGNWGPRCEPVAVFCGESARIKERAHSDDQNEKKLRIAGGSSITMLSILAFALVRNAEHRGTMARHTEKGHDGANHQECFSELLVERILTSVSQGGASSLPLRRWFLYLRTIYEDCNGGGALQQPCHRAQRPAQTESERRPLLSCCRRGVAVLGCLYLKHCNRRNVVLEETLGDTL